MTHNRFLNHCLICALILVTGLALTLPWLANAQSFAAQSGVGEQGDAPEATRYYVAKTGDGTDPYGGWDTAYPSLQDALLLAVLGGGGEIWAAAGVYYPDEGGWQTDNSPTSTFYLWNNIALYGGFDTDDTKLSDRDWEKNVTVLSGDIDGNDFSDENGVVTDTDNINGNNAYHVVTVPSGNITGILDGFTITAGQANIWPTADFGGGFLCDGDGIDNVCSPFLSNIVFSGNLANGYGGAMFNGGGHSGTSNPILTNVTFSGNSALYGGGMYNNANYSGTSSPSLTNVTFSGNWADEGGGMYNIGAEGTSSPSLTNVTFSGNWADEGGGMYNDGSFGTSSPVLHNSILWNNRDNSGIGTITAAIYNDNDSATTTLMHSLAQGTGGSNNWTSDTSFVNGGGNIDTDPLFILNIDPSTAPTTTGNLRLGSGSPAIDAGDNSFVTGVLTDLDGEARIVDGNLDGAPTVDIGAYETQIYYIYLALINR